MRKDGFAVDWVHDGNAAELALAQEQYAMMLLDLGLPHKNGLAVLRTLRTDGNTIPVLVTTARDAVADRVAGLDAGADDYLIKPYDLKELSARMRALLRRQSGRADSLIQVREVTLNPATHEVWLHDQLVILSAREFTLLRAFLDRPGMVLSRAQLEEKLYGWDERIDSNAVEVHIHALRKNSAATLSRTCAASVIWSPNEFHPTTIIAVVGAGSERWHFAGRHRAVLPGA